jgi:hypothetical protein
MEHGIDMALDPDETGDIVRDERKARVRPTGRDVFLVAGRKVIDADDLIAASQKTRAQVGANEARAAGDEDPSHLSCRSSNR